MMTIPIQLFIVFLLSLTNATPIIEVLEEAVAGTVLIDNLQHRAHLTTNPTSRHPYAAIGNPASPGIDGLEIRSHQFDGTLQLVVRDGRRGPDRESLCDTRHSTQALHPPSCDLGLVILHGDRQNPSYAKVTLRILDINDNTPVFPKGNLFELQVPEDPSPTEEVGYGGSFSKPTRLPTTITLPSAFDADLPENGVKFYHLTTVSGRPMEDTAFTLVSNQSEKSSYQRSTFRTDYPVVASSPALTISGPLDREQVPEYWFHLLAVDGGMPQRTGTLTLHISLTDVNDNSPRFRKPIYHQTTFVTSSLAYGSTEGSIEVVHIPETISVGSNLLTVRADDADIGPNAKLTYRITEPLSGDQDRAIHDSFTLIQSNETCTLRVSKPLDADTTQGTVWQDTGREVYGVLVKVTLIAQDAGYPTLLGQLSVYILIENINDNAPDISVQFTNPIAMPDSMFIEPKTNWTGLVGSWPENRSGSSTVAHLTVTDADLLMPQTGVGGGSSIISREPMIRCETNDSRFALEKLPSMSSLTGSDMSGLGSTSNALYFYRMSVLNPLDREAEEWVHVRIFCVDHAVPDAYVPFTFPSIKSYRNGVQMTGVVTVPIRVLDQNDNAPKFAKPVYHFSVLETPTVPSVYGARYQTGSDQPRTLIGAVRAFDSDTGDNGMVEYMLQNNPHEAFQLEKESGQLWRIGSLDREKYAQLELIVEARDRGDPIQSSTCQVKVQILDVNDHLPYWVTSIGGSHVSEYRLGRSEDGVFYFSISEDSEIGHKVGEIKAIDLDGHIEDDLIELPTEEQHGLKDARSNNGGKTRTKITYQLESVEDANVLTVNRRSGELRLNRRLDREARAHYEIRAFAIDNPTSTSSTPQTRHTATATIIMTVLDVNDNHPQFETPLTGQEFHIEPGSTVATPGTTLFTAKAHDADSGENATIRYSLDNSGHGLVEIDPSTGVCYIREVIQRNTLLQLVRSNQLALTEHVQTRHVSSQEDNVMQNTATGHAASELRSLSLNLIITAHDMGKPRQLNSSRTVRLVWDGQRMHDMQSIYSHDMLLKGVYGANLFGKLTRTERLVIPLVIGTFLLLIIICAILFGVARCRRYGKSRFANGSTGQRSIPIRAGVSESECCLCWSCWLPRYTPARSNAKQGVMNANGCGVEDSMGKHDPITGGGSVGGVESKLRMGVGPRYMSRCQTAMDMPLSNTSKSYLPDCIPPSDWEQPDTFRSQSRMGHMLINPKFHPEWKGRPRYSGSTLSRAFSEESLTPSKHMDVGYTALCAYPPHPPDTAHFAPIGTHAALQHNDAYNYYYHTERYPPRLNGAPYTGTVVAPSRTTAVCSTATAIRPRPIRLAPTSIIGTDWQSNGAPQLMSRFQSLGYGLNSTGSSPDGQQYERFTAEQSAHLQQPEGGSMGESGAAITGGGGWKTRVADAYAENTFV